MDNVIGWVIDRDYVNDPHDSVCSRVGYGQRAEGVGSFMSVEVERGLSIGDVADPVRFRLMDDDGEAYYGGSMRRDWLDGEEEWAFAPLVFGTADAGATELQYRDDSGQWVTL